MVIWIFYIFFLFNTSLGCASSLTVEGTQLQGILKEGLMTLEGPVTVKSEDCRLEAEKAFIYLLRPVMQTQVADINKIKFVGNPIKAYYKKYYITANSILFDIKRHILKLTKATVENGTYKVQADEIIYNIHDDKIEVKSDVNSNITLKQDECT